MKSKVTFYCDSAEELQELLQRMSGPKVVENISPGPELKEVAPPREPDPLPGKQLQEVKCALPECEERFIPKTEGQKYCCKKHYNRAYQRKYYRKIHGLDADKCKDVSKQLKFLKEDGIPPMKRPDIGNRNLNG